MKKIKIKTRKNPDSYQLRDVVDKFDKIGKRLRPNKKSIEGDLAYGLSHLFMELNRASFIEIDSRTDAIQILNRLEKLIIKVKKEIQDEII